MTLHHQCDRAECTNTASAANDTPYGWYFVEWPDHFREGKAASFCSVECLDLHFHPIAESERETKAKNQQRREDYEAGYIDRAGHPTPAGILAAKNGDKAAKEAVARGQQALQEYEAQYGSDR